MRKCNSCFKYYQSGWCPYQSRGRYYGSGCNHWRNERSWLLALSEYLTDFWYNHILKLFRR